MFGTPSESGACSDSDDGSGEHGVIPRLLQDLFQRLEQLDAGCEAMVTLSLVEIYMEQVRDLLAPVVAKTPSKATRGTPARTPRRRRRSSAGAPSPHTPAAASAGGSLRLRVDGDSGTMYVEGAARVAVPSASGAMTVVAQGMAARAVGSTLMNQDSSRSHCVLMVDIDVTDGSTGTKRSSRITLVDLAGSEMVSKTGAQGVTLAEAKNINKSLSALGNVIQALTSSSSHVPYRDSKLTRLLQDSLGGNARTTLLVTLSADPAHAPESLSTLRFGERAAHVKNRPVACITRSLADYKALVQRLTLSLETLQAENDKLKQLGAPPPAPAPAQATADASELRAQVQHLTARLEEAEQQRDSAVAALEAGVSTESAQAMVQAAKDSAAAEAEAQLHDMRTLWEAAQEQLHGTSRVAAALAEAKSEVEELRSCLQGTEEDLKDASARALTAEAEREAALESAREVQVQLAAVQAEAQQLLVERDDHQATAHALKEALAKKEQELLHMTDSAHEAAAFSSQNEGELQARLAELQALLAEPKAAHRREIRALRAKVAQLEKIISMSTAECRRVAGEARSASEQKAVAEASASQARAAASKSAAAVLELKAEVLRLRTQRDVYKSDCQSIMALVGQASKGSVLSPLPRTPLAPLSPQQSRCTPKQAASSAKGVPAGFSPFACHMHSPRAPTHVFESASASIVTGAGAVDCGVVVAATGIAATSAGALSPRTTSPSSSVLLSPRVRSTPAARSKLTR